MTAGRGSVPAYQVLSDALRARIITGELKPGEKLPIEPDLSTLYGVSRSTVREALRVLASQNLITTTRGPAGWPSIVSAAPLLTRTSISRFLRVSPTVERYAVNESAFVTDALTMR